MHLTIHRGSHEIGGSCIELKSEKSRILIDYGLPLVDENREPFDDRKVKGKSKEALIKAKILHNIKGLYRGEKPEFDAILLNHPHPDHYGLLSYVNPEIPVYMSKGCKILIETSNALERTDYNPENVIIAEDRKEFSIGDFKVTPFRVDHSGFDARAYLLECGGKKLFYSGDISGHGRKRIVFDSMVKSPPKGIDYLFLEGTTLGREEAELKTEQDVEEELVLLFKGNRRFLFLTCSSQNIDRIVSVFRACIRTGKVFVIDPYTASILNRLKEVSENIPQFDWGENIRVFFAPNRYTKKVLENKENFKFGRAKITWRDIIANKEKIVLKKNWTAKSVFSRKTRMEDAMLIWSQWHGYLKGEQGFWEKHKTPIIEMHSSGHAYPEELKQLVEAIKPKKIIPIHTFQPEDYKDFFKTEILAVKDKETVEI